MKFDTFLETFLNRTSSKRRNILEALAEEVYEIIANHPQGNQITLRDAARELKEKYEALNMYVAIEDAATILIQTGWYQKRQQSFLKEA